MPNMTPTGVQELGELLRHPERDLPQHRHGRRRRLCHHPRDALRFEAVSHGIDLHHIDSGKFISVGGTCYIVQSGCLVGRVTGKELTQGGSL